MKINHANIKALKPCDSRYENFKKHYPDFDSDLKEFLYLEEIKYSDKVWVFTRLATKEQNIKWAIMCAESVLQHFETKYPQVLQPRAALEAAEAYVLNPTEENKKAAADAANAAANAANAAYAANAANADYAAAKKQQEQLNLMFMIEAIS